MKHFKEKWESISENYLWLIVDKNGDEVTHPLFMYMFEDDTSSNF